MGKGKTRFCAAPHAKKVQLRAGGRTKKKTKGKGGGKREKSLFPSVLWRRKNEEKWCQKKSSKEKKK